LNKDDYILILKISERGLAEGKRPPLCDGCSTPFEKRNPDSQDYSINALILDGERFYGLECNQCIKSYFSKLPQLSEEQIPEQISQSIRLELAQEMKFLFSDF
jgi:hypothetical protein